MDKPKVSISCCTYNHEKFIRKTLDSFLMQKTNFKYEVLINDDASQDNTQAILREYEEKYPDIIKPIYQTENQYKLNRSCEKYYIFPRVQGEYVAICEGDDYWTDENKLQKQVDFLDSHKDYSLVFHPVMVKYDDGSVPDKIFPDLKGEFSYIKDMDFLTLLQKNFIQTNSVMYRWRLKTPEDLELFPNGILPSDFFLHLLHAQVGKIGYIDEVMSVYRRHQGGLWSHDNMEEFHLYYGIAELRCYMAIEKQFPEYVKYGGHKHTLQFTRELLALFIKRNRLDYMQEALKLCPDCLDV